MSKIVGYIRIIRIAYLPYLYPYSAGDLAVLTMESPLSTTLGRIHGVIAVAMLAMMLRFNTEHVTRLRNQSTNLVKMLIVRLHNSLQDCVKLCAQEILLKTQGKRQKQDVTLLEECSSIRRNIVEIRSILRFWFEQYPPDEARKKLWMVSTQSQSLREKVDDDITQQFSGVIVELAVSGLWKDWCNDTELYGYQGKVAVIVAFDQLARHVHRFYSRNSNTSALGRIPDQSTLDRFALSAAELLVNTHRAELKRSAVPLSMQVFSLMPFRHSNRLETLGFVQKEIDACDELIGQDMQLLNHFRKATNRRMAVLQDRTRSRSVNVNTVYSDEDILECFPFEADFSNVGKHPVFQTIKSFLLDRGVRLAGTPGGEEPCYIVVSLSGGVDSMVIASVLSHFHRSRIFNLYLVAVHIDYANRPESTAEANFVERYCNHLGMQFKCRRIDEVTRGVTERSMYEAIARTIRYDFYKDTVAQCQESTALEVGVMLGHHRGDLRENVLSNAHKGCGPLHLSGMTATSKNDGVTLYRPLLPLEKSSVFHYAHLYGVPYFKDTTPHWSTRGKLRNKLLPLLEEIYGEGSMGHLSNLAVESDQWRDLVFSDTLRPFLDSVTHTSMGLFFPTHSWLSKPLLFWKDVLREVLHSASLGMFSDKSVTELLKRMRCLHSLSHRGGWLTCRKDYGVYLREDGFLFIFKPSSFPWRKSDSYCLADAVLQIGEAKKVGPWRITAEMIESDSMARDKKSSLLKMPAMKSMEHLIQGHIVYYLEVPMAVDNKPLPLIFMQFSNTTRPLAWKRSDKKVQETLPLVGVDPTAQDGPTVLVKVELTVSAD